MADNNKIDIKVDKLIMPFAETRTKKLPAWVDARSKIIKDLGPVVVNRKLKLDGRKWKPKDLNDGVYAVARYELKLFAARADAIEKDLAKKLPKGYDFKTAAKDEAKEVKEALNKAADSLVKLWKDASKDITNKVDLALEEVEKDKGDNKKSLSNGDDALSDFEDLDHSALIKEPVEQAASILNELANKLKGGGDDAEDLFDTYGEKLQSIENEQDAIMRNAVSAMDAITGAGKKIAKDKNADPSVQDIGTKMSKDSKVQSSFKKLKTDLKMTQAALDGVSRAILKGGLTHDKVKMMASKFEGKNKSRAKSVDAVASSVSSLRKELEATKKEVKK